MKKEKVSLFWILVPLIFPILGLAGTRLFEQYEMVFDYLKSEILLFCILRPMTLEEQIQDRITQLRQIELFEHHLSLLSFDIKEAHEDLEKSEKVLAQEHKDVIKLENRANTWLFKKLRGGQEEQLEKEREEYYEAFLQTKEAKKAIELMIFEEKILSKKLGSLRSQQLILKNELLKLLEKREKNVSKFNTEKKSKLRDINQKIDQQHRVIKEAQDCLEVCSKMIIDLTDLFALLNNIHTNKLLYDISKSNELQDLVQKAGLEYRQINNKRKRLRKELRQLEERMPSVEVKTIIKQAGLQAKMTKEIIPPAFLDRNFSQTQFRRVSILYSMEEIEKMLQYMEKLATNLQIELDFLLEVNIQLKEEKASVLLK